MRRYACSRIKNVFACTIPRDPISYEHVQIKGLYPCGEGAGYAGGIISAAIDGEKCAVMIGES
jgi:uncharacterized FAD-dependent dehydrogenase